MKRKIKKYIYRNTFLSILLIGSLYIISWMNNNFFDEERVKFIEYNKLEKNSVNIVSLGSSHGKFGLNLWEKDELNLGTNSQNFYYDLKLVQKYEKKIKKEAVVIVPVSIFSFYNNYDSDKDTRYVIPLKRKELQNNFLNKKEYFFRKYFSAVFPITNFFKIIKYFLKNGINKNYVEYPENLILEKKIKDAQESGRRHIGIDSIYNKKNADKDFINLIEYLLKKEYKIIIITTPLTSFYIEEIEKIDKNIFEKRIYHNLDKILNGLNQNIFYFDYSHDSRIINNMEYFFDGNHLNKKGAEYFTEILLRDINEIEKS